MKRNVVVEGVLEIGKVNFELASIGPTGVELLGVDEYLGVGKG